MTEEVKIGMTRNFILKEYTETALLCNSTDNNVTLM